MQRVRAGLTGLAAIFLMVLIAAAGSKPVRPVVPAAGAHSETLAVLGVAPGSSSEADHAANTAVARVAAKTIRKLPTH